MNERVKQDWQLIGVECEETQVGRPTKDPHRHGPGRQKRETRDGAEEKGEDDEDESRRSCAIEQKNHLHSLSTVFGLRESETVINLRESQKNYQSLKESKEVPTVKKLSIFEKVIYILHTRKGGQGSTPLTIQGDANIGGEEGTGHFIYWSAPLASRRHQPQCLD